jgi:hypothetical protein
MIADAVKSRGRSRHGHLAGAAMTVATASGSATHADRVLETKSSITRLLAASDRKREGRLARVKIGRGHLGRGGNTPRWALFPSLFPLGEVSGPSVSRASEPGLPPLRTFDRRPVDGDGALFSQLGNQLANLLGNHHSGLTPACKSSIVQEDARANSQSSRTEDEDPARA